MKKKCIPLILALACAMLIAGPGMSMPAFGLTGTEDVPQEQQQEDKAAETDAPDDDGEAVPDEIQTEPGPEGSSDAPDAEVGEPAKDTALPPVKSAGGNDADGGNAPDAPALSVNGEGTVSMLPEEPSEGDRVTVTAHAAEGYYLAQIRISYGPAPAGGTDGEQTAGTESGANTDTDLTWETLEINDGKAVFTMPEDPVTVYADFISVVWDGTIDLTWYDASASSYSIRYPAQLAGAAALANGLFNDLPAREQEYEGQTIRIPDLTDDDGESIALEDYGTKGRVASRDGSGYQVFPDIDGDGIATAVAGDLDLIRIGHELADDTGSNNQMTSNAYWFGSEDFTHKTITLAADLDMGGVLENGAKKTDLSKWSGPNYMPLGGQFCMDSSNGYTRLSAPFNGTFDGRGHMVYDLFVSRHADTFGNCQSVGLIGLLGQYRVENGTVASPAVRNVALDGMIYGNRSIGGIVGKTVHSKGSVIENCINFATIYNTDAKGCGGIVGAGWWSKPYGDGQVKLYNCVNFGLVCTGYNKNAGGLVGSSEALVFDSYDAGYACGSGRGSASAGQALGTNNGGAVWYNCYTIRGAGSGEKNDPGNETPYVYGATYGSAIRVLEQAGDLKDIVPLLNGKVKNAGPDENGYMDSDDDVIPSTKRGWVTGEQNGGIQFISPHLEAALAGSAIYHDPADSLKDMSYQEIAVAVKTLDASGMPVPRTFTHDSADVEDIVCTGTPTKEYLTGETFDTGDHENQSQGPDDTDADAEFSVWAVFSDGTWQEIEDYDVIYEGGASEFTTAAENVSVQISVDYLGTHRDFTVSGITVTSCSLLDLRVTVYPNNTFYGRGEDFEPDGMTISADYGVKGTGGAEDVKSMWIKAAYSDGGCTLTKRVIDRSHSDQTDTQYKEFELTGEAANAFTFSFSDQYGLQEGLDAITVSHTFNGETMTVQIPVTVIGDPPRLVKDGMNNKQIVYIKSEGDLKWFANQIASGLDQGMDAVLENDVEITDADLYPIGTKVTSDKKTTSLRYLGTFNGNDHTITLHMDRGSSNAALFYIIGDGAKVRDLTIAGTMSGGSKVGGLATQLAGGQIDNCRNTMETVRGSGSYVGGLVGDILNDGSRISGSSNEATVTGGGYAGGIAGRISADDVIVSGCMNSGEVRVQGTTYPAGGIAASLSGSGSSVASCRNTGSVSTVSETVNGSSSAIGGIAGTMGQGTLSGDDNTGNVEGFDKAVIGGILGQSTSAASTIEGCSSSGAVILGDPQTAAAAGGIAGNTVSKTNLKYCFNEGTLQAEGGGYTGAVIGKAPAGTNVKCNFALKGTADDLIVSSAAAFVPSDENACFLPKADELVPDDEDLILRAEAQITAGGEEAEQKLPARTGEVLSEAKEALQELKAPQDAAAAAADIDALPPLDEITLDDRQAIEQARQNYEQLPDEAKKLVPEETLRRLKAAEQKLAGLIEAARISIGSAAVSGLKTKVYNGRAQTQTAVLTLNGKTLKQGTDYTVSYASNVKPGTAKISFTGIGSYKGVRTASFRIIPRAADMTVKLAATTMVSTGKALKPAVSVSYGGRTWKAGTDYTVAYLNNIRVGTGTAAVSGKNFSGTKNLTFRILPGKASAKAKAGKKSMKVTIASQKDQGVTKYQISYRIKGKSWKNITVTKTKKTIKKLKKGKKYQVRVRAYGPTGYGAYSKVITVKIK